VPQQRKRGADGGRRAEVLEMLRAASRPLSIVEIADRLGVHPNTVRFHLGGLVEAGRAARVEVDRRAAGRPPQLFQALRRMDPFGHRDYRLLAEVMAAGLATGPDPPGRAIETGRSWGRGLEPEPTAPRGRKVRGPVERLIVLLDDLGFAPERERRASSDRPPRIALKNCPFLELAANRPQIACSIHLGLMRGALEAWGAGITVERLEAFAEPDLCRVHLAKQK
jgi:predicted ArsR family transcriptional regulator